MKFTGWLAAAVLLLGMAQAQAQSQSVGGRVDAAAAADIAMRALGGSQVAEVTSDTKDGRSVWEVEVIRGGEEIEVLVDAGSGRILETEEKGSISSSKQRRLKDIQLPLSQAMDSALAHAGGGRVTKVDVDREDGRTVWEFDIEVAGDKKEVAIDATSGNIIETEGALAWMGLGSRREIEPRSRARVRDQDVYGYRDDVYGYRGWEYESAPGYGRYDRFERYDRYEPRYYYSEPYYYRDDDLDYYLDDDWDDRFDDDRFEGRRGYYWDD